MAASVRAKVEQGSNGGARWEQAARPLPAVLRPWVTKCAGYGEWAGEPIARREVPLPRVVVILEIDMPIRLHDPADEAKVTTFRGGFVAGLDDRSTLTTHDGIQRGIQIDLTPTAARRCFDRPMSELLGQAVPLVDLLPCAERHLCERLAGLRDWDALADGDETQKRYSISEWWLEPNTKGPGGHSHEEDDIFYVIEGTMSFLLGERWVDAPRGSFVLARGGIKHDFENRTDQRAGALNFCSGRVRDENAGHRALVQGKPTSQRQVNFFQDPPRGSAVRCRDVIRPSQPHP
ncbi:MAG: cupin domain-containing protein [Polyangiaceae bacterium]